MNILKWLLGLFPSDDDERTAGYRHCMSLLEKGTSVEELEILSDGTFDFTPFDAEALLSFTRSDK